MKTLLLFLLPLLSFSQQKGMVLIEGFQEKPIKVIAHVQDQIGDVVILQPTGNSSVSYKGKYPGLENEKEYVFWVVITGCKDCRTKQVEILEADFTVQQIQRDQQEAGDRMRRL